MRRFRVLSWFGAFSEPQDGECHANFAFAAPHHAGRSRHSLLRDEQLDRLRQADCRGNRKSRPALGDISDKAVLPLWKLRDAPIKERWRGEFRGSLIGWASSMNKTPLEGVTPNLSRTGKREPGRRDGLFATRIFRRRRCAIARRTHCPPAVLTTALVSRICRSLSSWRRLFVTFQLFEARRSRQ